MADLITLNDLTSRIALTASEQSVAPTLITRASSAIERLCRRSFAATTQSGWYSPDVGGRYYLPSPPIQILSIYDLVSNVLSITYSGTSPIALFRPTWNRGEAWEPSSLTSLSLVTMSSGVESAQALSLASYPTIGSLATAISSVANWSATTSFASWPSSHIYCINPISVDAQSGSELPGACKSAQSLSDRDITPAIGVIRNQNSTRLIRFSSGFAAVPGPIAELCVEAVIGMLGTATTAKARASGVKKAKLGDLDIEFQDAGKANEFQSKMRCVTNEFRIKVLS